MSSTKAKIAKDKGNAAFKAGEFPTAIGHYTEAIIADPSDHTLPLNRAAAYLKLNKYEDAERDCTTTLVLQEQNVKAFYRRGLARLAQAKVESAMEDLNCALSLEPDNESVKQELTRASRLLEKTGKPSVGNQSASGPTKRRRVPITVVEPSAKIRQPGSVSRVAPHSRQSSENKHDSSRANASPERPEQASEKPSFTAVKEARTAGKPSLVGGGIFRRSGEHTIYDAVGETSGTTPSSSTATGKQGASASAGVSRKLGSPIESPIALFDFARSWNDLHLPADRWQLLSEVPPTALPSMFQSSLDANLLGSIMETLSTCLDHDPDILSEVKEYILGLQKVPRFGTVVLLMTKHEREIVNAIWNKLHIPSL